VDALEEILNLDLISIGDKQLTLGSVIYVVLILLATWLVATLAGRATTGFFNRLSAKDKSAAKTVIGNLFASCVIRFEKEVRRGDLVIIDNRWVTVESIGLRTTKARTYDGQQVLIPN
jgi:small-conductance mechanosensitive channel